MDAKELKYETLLDVLEHEIKVLKQDNAALSKALQAVTDAYVISMKKHRDTDPDL